MPKGVLFLSITLLLLLVASMATCDPARGLARPRRGIEEEFNQQHHHISARKRVDDDQEEAESLGSSSSTGGPLSRELIETRRAPKQRIQLAARSSLPVADEDASPLVGDGAPAPLPLPSGRLKRSSGYSNKARRVQLAQRPRGTSTTTSTTTTTTTTATSSSEPEVKADGKPEGETKEAGKSLLPVEEESDSGEYEEIEPGSSSRLGSQTSSTTTTTTITTTTTRAPKSSRKPSKGRKPVATTTTTTTTERSVERAKVTGEEPNDAQPNKSRLLHHRKRKPLVRLPFIKPKNDSVCIPEAYLEFPRDPIGDQWRGRGLVLVHILVVCYMFYSLALVCERYFMPSLEEFALRLQLSEDVAGATLMSAGSSAPELFTAILGVFVAKGDVGTGAIVGSAGEC